MSGVDELVAFLRRCLDEDERVAMAAGHGERDPFDGSGVIVMPVHGGTTRSVTLSSTVAEHIARWPPARVLAEVKAKRQMLDEFSWEAGETRAIMYLAQPYAGQDGWREEWAL